MYELVMITLYMIIQIIAFEWLIKDKIKSLKYPPESLEYSCDGRPVWSRTSDCQSGNPGSNPGRRTSHFHIIIMMVPFLFLRTSTELSENCITILNYHVKYTRTTVLNLIKINMWLAKKDSVCKNRVLMDWKMGVSTSPISYSPLYVENHNWK